MKLTTRQTHSFIEVKTDEIETTLFKYDQTQLKELIWNLLDVADQLSGYTDLPFNQYCHDYIKS